MRVIAATRLVLALLLFGTALSVLSVSEAREIPPRAISADAVCQVGEVNGRDGFICRDGSINYFCTEPRAVCWPIIPPGPYHRGDWRAPSAASQAVITRATR
jgi:hypothetical protein